MIIPIGDRMIIPIGTKTPHGKVIAITNKGGERYYFLEDGYGIALLPADVVEPSINQGE